MKPDLDSFRRWAYGDLVDNCNRGIFAEWLVGIALGVAGDDKPRREWDACDFRYSHGLAIEVKAAGLSQTWKQSKNSTPRFSIKKQKEAWDAATNKWTKYNPPRRTADLYVFCLHEAVPATNDNVADPSCWKFWVVSTDTIDEKLGGQASLGLGALGQLAAPVPWQNLKAAVDNEAGNKPR